MAFQNVCVVTVVHSTEMRTIFEKEEKEEGIE